MRTFFLFSILTYILRNPLLALLVMGVIFYFSEARYHGRYFNPGSFFRQRSAIRELRHAVEMNDHDVAAHNDLGRLLCDEGKFEEAQEHLAKAIRRMDESPETNFYHGLCLMKSGRSDDGVEHVKAALRINARFGYGNPQIVLARHYLEAGELSEAVDWAGQAVKLNTSSVEGWTLLGHARSREGNPGEAADAYAAAIEAYKHLPHYLKLANRQWLKEAKKGASA